DASVAQEIGDLIDRAPLPDELCRQAMAQQMCTRGPGKLNPASFQSRTDDPRNGGGALERARWRRVGQEHSRAADPRPGMQDVVCKRRSCFVQERNDSVALPLGSPHKDFCGCVSSEGW